MINATGKKLEKSGKKLKIFYHIFPKKLLIINESRQKKDRKGLGKKSASAQTLPDKAEKHFNVFWIV